MGREKITFTEQKTQFTGILNQKITRRETLDFNPENMQATLT